MINIDLIKIFFQKMQSLSYSAMASLMVIGGFDNRPRIGGNVLIKKETEGFCLL